MIMSRLLRCTGGLYLQPFKGKDGWRFRMRARNNKILMSSEAYSSEAKMRLSLKLTARFTGLPVKEK